jgi:CheY-like chemotaxis protein
VTWGIVQQHGGVIRAESRVGHGSTFHVYLPLHGEPATFAAETRPADDLAGRETILVAEDEVLIRELLNDSLGDLGYTVLFAENGAEAAEMFARDPDEIDMVILDVVMPKMSGPEAFKRMQAVRPGIRALFISGHAPESAHLAEQLQAAGRAFLAKPFLLDALATKVRSVLDGDV